MGGLKLVLDNGELVPRAYSELDPHVYGISYPVDASMHMRDPVPDDAIIDKVTGERNEHFVDGGNTADLLAEPKGLLVNTMTREWVVDGGRYVPKSSFFWALGRTAHASSSGGSDVDRALVPFEETIVRVHAGEVGPMDALTAFNDARVLVPSATESGGDLRRLSPLRFETPEGPMIAVFTHADRIEEFATDAPYLVDLLGWQLVDSLPPEVGVVINPRREIGLQFPPPAIQVLRDRMARARAATVQRGGDATG